MACNNFDTMEAFHKEETGLPFNIYVQVEKPGTKSEKKIFFQINKLSCICGQSFCPMSFNGVISEKAFSGLKSGNYFDICDDDIMALRNFLENNRFGLQLLSSGILSNMEFQDFMIGGGELVSGETEEKTILGLKKCVLRKVVEGKWGDRVIERLWPQVLRCLR